MPETIKIHRKLYFTSEARWILTLAKIVLSVILSFQASKAISAVLESGAERQVEIANDSGATSSKPSSDYLALQEFAQAAASKAESDAQKLSFEIRLQDEKIKNLEKNISELRKPDENSVATLLLSAVSVIITVLGVLVAILAILGYRNIKNEAIKDARKTAKETVKVVTREELPKATEDNIVKLIEENRFDKLIQSAVENIVYRDTSIPDDPSDGEQQN